MKIRYIVLAAVTTLILGSCSSVKKGERLYQRFEYAKAIPVYEKIAASEGKHTALAYQRLGDINRLSSHFEQAANWYKKSTEAPNTDPEVYINYGQVLRSLGQYEEAIVQFEKYMQLNPADTRAKLYADYCRQFLSRGEVTEFFDIVNAKSLNSSYSDFSPVISNGKVIFTSDRNSGSGSLRYGWTGAYYLDLYQADLPEFDSAGKEKNITPELYSKELNMAYHDGPASFSPDNKTIYFTRVFRKMGDLDTSRYYTNKLKIFTSKLEDNEWSSPEPFYLNNDDYSVGHPAVSPDGNTLYFISDMPGGTGGTDIYSVDMVDGKWSNLKNAGTDINTFGNEMFPAVDNTGTLYFASDGWPGLGSLDIFKTSFVNGKWSKPENMKEPINSSADDFGFFRNSDGRILFSSNRPGGKGGDDIYMAQTIKYADEVVVSGTVRDRQDGAVLADATVLMWNTTTEEVLIIKTDANGEYKTTLKPGKSYIFKAVKKGYTTDCLNLTIPQYTRSTSFKNRDLMLMKLKINEIYKLENVYYDFDKWNIRQDASAELDKVVSFLKQNTGVSIELGSHTDSRGTDRYNDKLADRRAESAVKYIVGNGISKDRITAKGYGETQLVNKCADNVECTDAEHQANRRTVIKITGLAQEEQVDDIEPLEAYKNGQVIKLNDLKKDFFIDCSSEKVI